MSAVDVADRVVAVAADRVEIAAVHPAAAVLLGPERETRVHRHERAIDDEFETEVREYMHDRSGYRDP